MLKYLVFISTALITSCVPKNEANQGVVSYVNNIDENLRISFEQVSRCQIKYGKHEYFSLERTKHGVYLLPKNVDVEKKELTQIETKYGSFGVRFNNSLPKLLENPEWINMFINGLQQKSNDKTNVYYVSRFFPFNVSHPKGRQVFVFPEDNTFIMKSMNENSVQMFFYILQPEVVTLQNFDIKHSEYGAFVSDIGLSCENYGNDVTPT